jgi:lipopolysaccharide transport protein LptA
MPVAALYLAFAACLALGAPAGADALSDETLPLAVAVAPFERVAAPDAAVPEVDTLLADRIGTRGVARIVGPGQLTVAADAEPDAETARAWAKQADAEVLVVGRVTRIGSQLSLDVRLRSAESGAVVGTYVAEIAGDESLEAGVDRLAGQVVEGARAFLSGEVEVPASVSTAPPSAAAAPTASKRKTNPFGISAFDNEQPISISSGELEAVKQDGARRLLFTKNVVVTQADVTIKSSRLEAFYPPNASQPERLVATGGVEMRQGDRTANCDNATYDRGEEILVCRGNAVLVEGEDHVRGNVIEFDLDKETVKVKGGAEVVIAPESEPTNGSGGTGR